MNVAINSDVNRVDDHYPEFLQSIQNRFNASWKGLPLFTTNASGLFDVFLSHIPEDVRQIYTCRACRHFVERFGGLVTIDALGNMHSVLWDETMVPDFFVPAVREMKSIVMKSSVTGVFFSDMQVLGQPVTGIWTHMALRLPIEMVHRSRLTTAFQAAAEKLEERKMLISSLMEYPVEVVAQALTLLETESLYRSEKVLGVAKWLKDLHDRRANTKNSRQRDNIVWVAVATAPIGFCHIKSSMIGTLLDDIVAGMSFAEVSRRFAEKMHPLQYQRPQAAPTAGNIAQAEKIVEKLGIERSLDRRYARLEELQTIWLPQAEAQDKSTGGVFSHLQPKTIKPTIPDMQIPTITMTWEKFARTVLPTAKSIEFQVKSNPDNFGAILTAVHNDAPPIIQWDKEDQRNPFSWYVYSGFMGGSSPSQWGLMPGYRKVTGICYQPSMWQADYDYQGNSVFFILDGAKDSNHQKVGNGLFPEILKSELREVRSTIEAHSKTKHPEGYDESSACGIRLQKGSNWTATFKVTSDAGTVVYKLDRWD